jgi:hypothetical protein
MKSVVMCVLFGTLLVAPRAAAQSPEGTVFVSGMVIAGLERYAHANPLLPIVSLTGDRDPSGNVLGAAFSLGTWLAPRVTLQVETAFLGSTTTNYTLGSVIPAGLSIVPASSIYKSEQRTTSVSVLAGYHPTAGGRVRLGYLAGVAIVRVRSQDTVTTRTVGFPPLVPPNEETALGETVLYPTGVVLGADALIRASRRLGVIPHLRVVAFSSGVSIRPGVSVRWTW